MTTPIRETMRQEVGEGGSCLLTATLLDDAKTPQPIPLAAIGTVRLWLYDEATDAPINGRTDTDIKNLNGGTIHATDGSFALKLGPLDNPILDPTRRAERHIAYIKITYNGGTGVVVKEAAILVRNLSRA